MTEWTSVSLPGLDALGLAVVLGGRGAIGSQLVAAFEMLQVPVASVSRAASDASTPGVTSGRANRRNFTADVGDRESLLSVAREIASGYGRPPTVVVNCAGVGEADGELGDASENEAESLLRVNMTSALWVAQAFAPQMARGSSMVFVSSISAHRVRAGSLIYGASKAGLVRLVRQLAVELGPSGIRVNAVSPGQTPTVLRRWSEPAGTQQLPSSPSADAALAIPLRRRGELDDYVGAILFLASGLASYVTGVDVLVEGGVSLVRATAY